MREMQREFSAKAKSIKPEIQIGYHIWHNISFNPIYRAEQDYRPYTEYADFLKPVVYDNPAGERMTSFVDSMTQNIFGDLSRQQMLDFEYSVMGFKEEKRTREIIGRPEAEYQRNWRSSRSTELRAARSSGSPAIMFTARRSARWMASPVPRRKSMPASGIDVQVKNSTPESVRDAVEASSEREATAWSSPPATPR